MTSENEEKKNYLMRYQWGRKRIEEIELEIAQLRLSALPGAINYDGMPKGTKVDADMSGYAAKMDALITKRSAFIRDMVVELSAISDAIEAVTLADPKDGVRCALLLRYRYILMEKDWEIIGDAVHCSGRHAQRLHGKALTLFQIP